MIDACKRNGKKMSMGLQNRGLAAGYALKKFIETGGLGQIYYTRVWTGHVMNIPGYSVFHNKALSGGGVLYSTAVHTLDFATGSSAIQHPLLRSGLLIKRYAT